jgi:5-methylcytosine-specific restriction enzyme A
MEPDMQIAAALMGLGRLPDDDPLVDALMPLMTPRAGGWSRVRAEHLLVYPRCEVCGTKQLLEVHHIFPVHLFDWLELEPRNLVTMCPPHHLLFGHLMNWRAYNPHVLANILTFRRAIAGRRHDAVTADTGFEGCLRKPA